MERVKIFHGQEEGSNGFASLQSRINEWFDENESINRKVEVVARNVSLVVKSSSVVMVVTIFYTMPEH